MAKELRELDREAQRLLSEAVKASGKPHSMIGRETGISQNRVSIILRLDTPPATVGEYFAIADSVGVSARSLIQQAEQVLAAEVPTPEPAHDPFELAQTRADTTTLPDPTAYTQAAETKLAQISATDYQPAARHHTHNNEEH